MRVCPAGNLLMKVEVAVGYLITKSFRFGLCPPTLKSYMEKKTLNFKKKRHNCEI
jgi:hypothetical protein